MRGLMQPSQLTLDTIFTRAETLYPDHEVITGGPLPHRYTYADWAARTRQLGSALDTLGLSDDGRVATFCWNHYRHLELYFAAPCSGRVLHTLNIRLFPDQVVYIANHAEDEVVFVDRSLLPLFAPLVDKLTTVRTVVVIDDVPPGADGPEIPTGEKFVDYEELISAQPAAEWHIEDEGQAAAMCYTSGTTGNPKGVVYSHRSAWLHSLGATSTAGLGLRPDDRLLPIVPMFHANAWGLAHAAPMVGATLVFPGADMRPAAIAQMLQEEKVTITGGVPTIWQGMLPLLPDFDLSAIRRVICGGSSVPGALIKAYEEALGVPILQAWGMTETSPAGTIAFVDPRDADGDPAAVVQRRARAGVPVPGVEVRIVEPGTIAPLGWDDTTTGELQVRGAWIAADYHNPDEGVVLSTEDGWMRTGDVAAIDTFGSVRIVDRTKDLVKSGGEWISSVDIENLLMGHPDVAEAAIIGVAHPKWDERPVAFVVRKPDAAVTGDELLDFLRPKIAKWWVPDAVEFIDEVPKTSVGKFSKKDLRSKYSDYVLPD